MFRAPSPIGWYIPEHEQPRAGAAAVVAALHELDVPFGVVLADGEPAAITGSAQVGGRPPPGATELLAWVGALQPHQLGAPAFRERYGLRYAYIAGAMANGIASTELVATMARAGMLGFFGAAGLGTQRIEQAVDRLQAELGDLPFGCNLIHAPSEPRQEQETVALYRDRGVRLVSASAYLGLTPMVVEYRCAGLSPGPSGAVRVGNRLLAKVSRPEVAEAFLRPPPAAMVEALISSGRITAQQARLSARVPMADELTAEADSGGHTDNRAAAVLLPVLSQLRDRIAAELGLDHRVGIGLAGGIGCPEAAAAGFALGADYVMTGSINQACVEAGTSDAVRAMLADAGMADVDMAPSSDMFEAGVRVQVLRRGTMFPMRAQRLYELYRTWDSLDALPDDVRADLERRVFRQPLDSVWAACESYFASRDPAQLERAARDPRHKLALVCRWYLGQSSHWAIAGQADRRADAQVWCGPAIGAFNAWTRGTFLADPTQRSAVVVAANLLAGACAHTRGAWLRDQGVDVGSAGRRWVPRPLKTSLAPRSAGAVHARP